MTIYSIADLHLSKGDKPMDVFGAHWEGHFDRIREDWICRVRPEDVVLLPGDISWEMRLEETGEQLAAIGSLPGRKVLLRGNHDYWWSAIGRVRAALPEGMYALQNDAIDLGEAVVCGSRGWLIPDDKTDPSDRKIFEREKIRLEMSLKAACAIRADRPCIAMTHFPPLSDRERDTDFSRLLAQYRADAAVYGHLHGEALKNAFSGLWNGVMYHQVSCDGLGFRLKEILTIG